MNGFLTAINYYHGISIFLRGRNGDNKRQIKCFCIKKKRIPCPFSVMVLKICALDIIHYWFVGLIAMFETISN